MMFFANNNFVGKITLNNADENQSTLSIEIVELKKNRKSKWFNKKN